MLIPVIVVLGQHITLDQFRGRTPHHGVYDMHPVYFALLLTGVLVGMMQRPTRYRNLAILNFVLHPHV
jgi:hypothetical protein